MSHFVFIEIWSVVREFQGSAFLAHLQNIRKHFTGILRFEKQMGVFMTTYFL